MGPKDNLTMPKPYCCTVPQCNKMYKNLNGLKYHFAHSHPQLWEEILRDGVSVGSLPGVSIYLKDVHTCSNGYMRLSLVT
jgi:hypothetical protein